MDPDWRCVSYWHWRYSIAMLVYQRVIFWGVFSASVFYGSFITCFFSAMFIRFRLIGGEGCWHTTGCLAAASWWWAKACQFAKCCWKQEEILHWDVQNLVYNGRNYILVQDFFHQQYEQGEQPPPSYCHGFLISGGKNLVGLRAVTWLDQSTWFGSVCSQRSAVGTGNCGRGVDDVMGGFWGLGICQFISRTGTEHMCPLTF